MKPRLVSERARAKINLGLHILGRRQDGYHELDSIVAFADVADVLILSASDELSLEVSGPFAGSLPARKDNIILKAYRSLADFTSNSLPPVKIHLEKNLPVASGIGGGSADAAAALRGLQRLFEHDLKPEEMRAIALQLGADVPVCLTQQTCRMRGIGEIIEPLDIALPTAAVLVNPQIPAHTAQVFETLGLERGSMFGSAIQNINRVESWRNDLTAPAMTVVPEIAAVLEALERCLAVTTARMSGSGSTCFGLTQSPELSQFTANQLAEQHPGWWVKSVSLGQ